MTVDDELGPIAEFGRVIRDIEAERQNPKDLMERAAKVESLRTQPHISGGVSSGKIAGIVAGVVVIGGALFFAFKDKLAKPKESWAAHVRDERGDGLGGPNAVLER